MAKRADMSARARLLHIYRRVTMYVGMCVFMFPLIMDCFLSHFINLCPPRPIHSAPRQRRFDITIDIIRVRGLYNHVCNGGGN